MYDAIVIGARCAGSPTAMLLARKGYRVLLVDRATFPSDIPHGHFIHRSGPRRLNDWGLLERLTAAGTPPVRKRIVDFGDFPLAGTDLEVDGVVQAPLYQAISALACYYFSYWSGILSDALELYVRDHRVIFAFPTNRSLFAVFIGWREERFYGTADLPNFFRKPGGPGWALVGDAGNHKDPFLALGVADAFRDAELLARAVDEGLSGNRPMEEALAEYERQRNETAMPDYQQNLDAATFKPLPAEVYQLRAAVRGSQYDINQLIMANQGMIPREAFFNPKNLERIMASAQRG